ncbi:MAG: NAD(P)/FAD-dependent oxidoreductase [Candidatus Promineifilaceae bacterium]|nr:NAD(P)/FAD-dependent oxidoreductase [Candidatus Promineifilaceae bacterium]
MTEREQLRIGVVGGGVAGLAAAYDLLGAGHEVTVLEASDHTGGLAAGFCDERWDWPLEKFYHHLFTSDRSIIGLVEELGIRDRLFFPRPITSVIYDDEIVPFDSPLAWIRFPGFKPWHVVRFGLVSAFLRFTNPWRYLEQFTADVWLRRWYGDHIYETTWRPLLIGKFGPYYRDANMAWMWARLKVRSPHLGYFEGGFQMFIDKLTAAVEERGGDVRLNHPVRAIEPQGDGPLLVRAGDGAERFDRVIVTTSPGLLSRMAPALPPEYLGQLEELKSMGAVVLTLALRRQLMEETYWLNIPAESPDKRENEFPFLALVEHTNYIDRSHYGGDHLVYCGDYVAPDHDYFEMDKDALESLFVRNLHKINPTFEADWVRKSWLFRARYAQPVPEVNHSERIPALRTPIPGLYFASMSQVYPWDRGTNFAVEIGRRVARLLMDDSRARNG